MMWIALFAIVVTLPVTLGKLENGSIQVTLPLTLVIGQCLILLTVQSK